MRKMIAFCIICMFLLTSCGETGTQFSEVNTQEGITLSLVEGTLTSTSATFLLTNDTENEIYCRDAYHLEEKDSNGQWQEFVGTASAAFGEETIPVDAGTSVELPIHWKTLCGSIGKGEFRMIVEVDGKGIATEFVLE